MLFQQIVYFIKMNAIKMLQYQAFLMDHLKFQSFKEKLIFVIRQTTQIFKIRWLWIVSKIFKNSLNWKRKNKNQKFIFQEGYTIQRGSSNTSTYNLQSKNLLSRYFMKKLLSILNFDYYYHQPWQVWNLSFLFWRYC